MNPTTSTTFVAYRDPRYVQGKALLKAKQYDTAIDALAGNFSSSSSMNTNNSSSSTSGSMMMMMSPTSNNSSNQNSSSNNSNNNNNTEKINQNRNLFGNSGFDKPTSNRMGGSGSDGVTTIGFGGSSSSSKMSSNAPTPDSFKSSTGNSANKKDNEPKVEYGFGKQTLPTSTATNILQGRKKSKKRKLDSTSLSLPSSSSSSSGTNLLAVKKKVKVQAVVQGEQSTEAMDIEADEAKTTTTTVVVVEKTPEEIARENLKKAEKDLKESIHDLEKKEQMIHAEMEADEEQKKHDAYLRGLARDLLSLEPATDAVTDCVIDLIADVQEMYYDEKNPWDPREKEELNYDKIDEVNFSMDIESDGGDTNNNKADNINDNNGLTKIVSKNAIPVDNHPTYFTEHFQKIFNEFAYCNVQYIALSFNDGPLGITLEAIDGRPDLYRVAQLNPDGQAAKKIVLQVGDILRTVNNIEVQGKDFDDVVKIIQKVKRPAIFRFSRHGRCVPLPKKPRPPRSLKERLEDLRYERLQRSVFVAREQTERYKLRFIEANNRMKEAEATAKHVSKQNSELRREINKHVEEQTKRDKVVDKMKSKYQKFTKQAQDAVIQRSLLSTEIARLKEELERNKSELHRSNMTRINELNTQAVSATINPEKNDEMKKKLKLARAKCEQYERSTEKRRMDDAKKAKYLPKRFRKCIRKRLNDQIRIPNECLTGRSGRGEFAITVEHVPDYVFNAIFGNVGKGIDNTGDKTKNSNSNNIDNANTQTIVNGTKIRKMLTSNDVFNCFGKTFRQEQSITIPKPKRFILDLAAIKGEYSLALTYQTDNLSLKIIGVFTCEEAVGMAASLGKNIRLGGM